MTGEHGDIDGFATLMRRALSGCDLGALGAELLAREAQPDGPGALIDLSTLLHMRGNHDVALSVQRLALTRQQLFRLRSRAERPSVRVLALMVPGDLAANTPIECLVEDSDIALHMLYVAPGLPWPTQLPEHDVVFVAVGEATAHRAVLSQIAAQLEGWPRPVLNRPDRIAAVGRSTLCSRLAALPALAITRTVKLERARVDAIARGACDLADALERAEFPIIIRPLDSHAGKGLQKVERAAELANYLEARPEAEFFLSRFIDYRSPDGLYRKFRVALVGGKPFAAHMALSEHWMIHYVNAGMTESAAKRAEEARFMETFDAGFARAHAQALRSIYERTRLDYCVVDCAETREGELLVFELDNSAVVHALDPVDMFPYKQAPMRKVFAAFRELLLRVAARA